MHILFQNIFFLFQILRVSIHFLGSNCYLKNFKLDTRRLISQTTTYKVLYDLSAYFSKDIRTQQHNSALTEILLLQSNRNFFNISTHKKMCQLRRTNFSVICRNFTSVSSKLSQNRCSLFCRNGSKLCAYNAIFQRALLSYVWDFRKANFWIFFGLI